MTTPHQLSDVRTLDVAAVLVDQFVLSTRADDLPSSWPTRRIGEWVLGSHPRLPVVTLTDTGGGHVGWMVGYPIGDSTGLIAHGAAIAVPDPAVRSATAAARFVEIFGGRFAVAIVAGPAPAVHLDALGSMSLVFAPRRGAVASTPSLIHADDDTPARAEPALGIPDRNAMYPLGMTARHGVERLLPNHHLDLTRWRSARSWPTDRLTEHAGTAQAIADVADLVRRQIEAVVAAHPTYLYVTAGRDSRMLLACGRRVARQLDTVTIGIDDDDARVDVDVAARIAARFRLRHRIVPVDPPTDRDLLEWAIRTGSCTGEVRGRSATRAYRSLSANHAALGGNGGELARGFYWRPDDTRTTTIGVDRLLEICRCPDDVEARSRVQEWLDAVPATDSLQLLDLFYLEQRLGAWAGVWPYAQVEAGFLLFPLGHRRAVDAMLRLPASYRRQGRLAEDVIERTWPALGEYPFNEPIGLRLTPVRARRIARAARRLLRRRAR